MVVKLDSGPTVVFLSDKHANTTFLVDREVTRTGRSGDGIPIMELARDDKEAVFRHGSCITSDPEVVAFLDLQPDVVRAEDPLASFKLQHSPEEISQIEQAVRVKLQTELSYGEKN